MVITRPLLCARAKTVADLRFPVWATPKLDGIRALKLGSMVSRAFKPIRNRYIQRMLSSLPDGLDGELMVAGTFQDIGSGVNSFGGTPDFRYCIFDYVTDLAAPYYRRLEQLNALSLPSCCEVLPVTELTSLAAFLAYEAQCIAEGYEGVITRSALGPYKCGRSTLSEHYAVKFKRYEDSEALILGFTEQHTNQNEQVPNAFGLMKRPGGAGNKLPKGTLGSFEVQDIHTGIRFEVGTGDGLTTALRQQIWDNKAAYLGAIIRYRYQATGVKDRPRFPSFLGFRSAEDMS